MVVKCEPATLPMTQQFLDLTVADLTVLFINAISPKYIPQYKDLTYNSLLSLLFQSLTKTSHSPLATTNKSSAFSSYQIKTSSGLHNINSTLWTSYYRNALLCCKFRLRSIAVLKMNRTTSSLIWGDTISKKNQSCSWQSALPTFDLIQFTIRLFKFLSRPIPFIAVFEVSIISQA